MYSKGFGVDGVYRNVCNLTRQEQPGRFNCYYQNPKAKTQVTLKKKKGTTHTSPRCFKPIRTITTMVSQKKRLYVALYPSGVTNNAERECNHIRLGKHLTHIVTDTTGPSWSDPKPRMPTRCPESATTSRIIRLSYGNTKKLYCVK